jgi:hypothetical protein
MLAPISQCSHLSAWPQEVDERSLYVGRVATRPRAVVERSASDYNRELIAVTLLPPLQPEDQYRCADDPAQSGGNEPEAVCQASTSPRSAAAF